MLNRSSLEMNLIQVRIGSDNKHGYNKLSVVIALWQTFPVVHCKLMPVNNENFVAEVACSLFRCYVEILYHIYSLK